MVVIVNLADVAPSGTVTVAGTEADADELCSVTIAPPAGAGPFRVTVFAMVGTPLIAVVGDRMTDRTATGITVKVALLLTPP